MKKKLVQRRWSLVVAILLTIGGFYYLMAGDRTSAEIIVPAYQLGKIIVTVLVPLFFYVFAFFPDKN